MSAPRATRANHVDQIEGMSVQAACLTDKGALRKVEPGAIAKDIRRTDTTTWVHIRVNDKKIAAEFLEKDLGFHPLAVEDALSDMERPTLQEHSDHIFLSASTVEITDTGEEFIEVGFFLRESALVTIVSKPAPTFETWFDRWCDRASAFGTHPAFLLHTMLDAIVDNYFPATDQLEDEVDELTNTVYAGTKTHLVDAMKLKKRLLELRRNVAPIRDVINALMRRDVTSIPAEVKPYLQDVYDHTLRIADIVDISRENLATTMDAHLAIVSNNLNNVMRKMTVIATLLMSMALITGIYGMNFVHMPELKWASGYPFALGMMAFVAIIELMLFRRMKWL